MSDINKTYAYFPGCTQLSTGRYYDSAARKIAQALGIDLVEIPDWNCCGATMTFADDEEKAVALAARNLARAEGRDIVTPCSGCFITLSKTVEKLASDKKLRERIDSALNDIEEKLPKKLPRIRLFVELILNDVGIGKILEHKKRSLEGLKVACYYGCQTVRPYSNFKSPENPMELEELVAALGGTPVDFPLKTQCCGGSIIGTAEKEVHPLLKRLLIAAHEKGADIMITPCPLCEVNLDLFQHKLKLPFRMPVVFFTHLLGIALGIDSKELGIGKEMVSSKPILEKYSIT